MDGSMTSREAELEKLLIEEIHFEHGLIEKRLNRYYAAISGVAVFFGFFFEKNKANLSDAWIFPLSCAVFLLSVACTASILGAWLSQEKLSSLLDKQTSPSIYSNRSSKRIAGMGLMSAIAVPGLLAIAAMVYWILRALL